jgi:hypothetical protein
MTIAIQDAAQWAADHPFAIYVAGVALTQFLGIVLPEGPRTTKLLNLLHGLFASPQVMTSGKTPSAAAEYATLYERLQTQRFGDLEPPAKSVLGAISPAGTMLPPPMKPTPVAPPAPPSQGAAP